MKKFLYRSLACICLSMILVTGSFTTKVYARTYTTQELCETWAHHASIPSRLIELYNMIISIDNGTLWDFGKALYNYVLSPRTRDFVNQACQLDPEGESLHGGHGGYWTLVNNSADDDNKNGGNRNYYTTNNYNDYSNYNIINDDHIEYTYNNTNYNYTFNTSYYNSTNNSYIFNLTNNNNLTIVNNYNSTNILYNGETTYLYYRLPDGSNSVNLTEEEALYGYKTSLSAGMYENTYDNQSLMFLFHFDGNEYDSAYNPYYNLSISDNSVNYVNSNNFNGSVAFEGNNTISINTNDIYYSFRFYPNIDNVFSLAINGSDITKRESMIQSTYDYVEWVQTTTGESEQFVQSGQSTFQITLQADSTTRLDTTDFPNITNYTREFGTIHMISQGVYSRTCIYSRQAHYENTDMDYSTTQRTYNIINNKLYEDTGSNLVNYGMWNFVCILIDGSVYINNNDTGIDIDNTIDLEIEIESDSIWYFDEFFGNAVDRSVIAPSMPYDTNLVYNLPDEYINNCILVQTTLSINDWKIGGYRPSQPVSGDVYISVDDVGNITSVQQFNGIEWISKTAAIYNEYLERWINVIGFNIFYNMWDYQDLNYTTGQSWLDTLIKFLTTKFDETIDAIKKIRINNDGDSTIIENDYNVDVDADLEVYIDDLIDLNGDIDLTDPDMNLMTGDGLSQLADIPLETIKVFTDNNIGVFIFLPIVIAIVGMII